MGVVAKRLTGSRKSAAAGGAPDVLGARELVQLALALSHGEATFEAVTSRIDQAAIDVDDVGVRYLIDAWLTDLDGQAFATKTDDTNARDLARGLRLAESERDAAQARVVELEAALAKASTENRTLRTLLGAPEGDGADVRKQRSAPYRHIARGVKTARRTPPSEPPKKASGWR